MREGKLPEPDTEEVLRRPLSRRVPQPEEEGTGLKVSRIRDYAYFHDIFLVLGSDKELQKWCAKHGGHEWKQSSSGRWMAIAEPSGYVTHYIVATTDHQKPWLLAVVAHEVLHLTFAVLKNAGIKYSDDSEEAFNYYFQFIFSEVVKRIGVR